MTAELVKCEACGIFDSPETMLRAVLDWYICKDEQECIARYSGWNDPPAAPTPEKPQQESEER